MQLVPVEMADRMVALARREAGWRSAAIILAAVLLVILSVGTLLLWPVGARAQGYNAWTGMQALDAPACPNHLPTYERGSAYGCIAEYTTKDRARRSEQIELGRSTVWNVGGGVGATHRQGPGWVAVSMRLRAYKGCSNWAFAERRDPVVRVRQIRQVESACNEARDVRDEDLSSLDRHDGEVPSGDVQSVWKLWSPRHFRLPAMARRARFHGRYGGPTRRHGNRPDRQQRQLRAWELSVGHASGQLQQPTPDDLRRVSRTIRDSDRVGNGNRDQPQHPVRSHLCSWMAFGSCILISALVSGPAVAQQVPREALHYQRDLTRTARSVWGMDAPVSALAGQLEQESAYKPDAVSWVGARGLAQMMPATAAGLARQYADLHPVREFDPRWALLAQSRLMHDLYRASFPAASNCQAYAFATASYNQGPGWTKRQRAAAVDPARYFDSAELVNPGKTAANYRETHRYVRRILLTLEPLYVEAGFGPGACTR